MKILHVINNLGSGGAEKLLVDLLPLFKKNNVETSLLLIDSKSKKNYIDKLNHFGIDVIQLNINLYSFSSIKYLRTILENYDIVHAHIFPSSYFVYLAAVSLKNTRTKLVITEHVTTHNRSKNFLLAKIDKLIYNYYDKIIAITEEVKIALVKRGVQKDKIKVINNGIPLLDFSPITKDNLSYTIGMVGRLNVQKDQETIIKALPLLPEGIKLLLAGEGNKKERLIQLADSLNVVQRVEFLGYLTNVVEFFKKIDIHIFSSNYEGFGLSAVESMACKIPTIASKIPGLQEVVANGGVLFEHKNENQLADEIMNLYKDRNYFFSVAQKGYEKAKIYDINVMYQKYKNLYLELLN